MGNILADVVPGTPGSALRINRRYQLHGRLGQGGMGTVYRAYDRLTRETVALKQVSLPADILPFATPGVDPAVALALEFRVLAGLRHPHIVSVFDYGFDAGRFPFFTMQLIEDARTITAYAATADDATKIRLTLEVLQVLMYLHRRGIQHRDLKPSNVLVAQNGAVKVMDFGLARPQETSVQLVRGVVGTLSYMAPELLDEVPTSVASDLYAVGVILAELFGGQHPFTADRVAELIDRILTGPPNLAQVPAHLKPVVERLLAKTPQERYASAEEVIKVLCAVTGTPMPSETALLRESFLQVPAFVGRETELERLQVALAAAADGQGSFWLVGGESGVGKSRLLDELRSRALVQGATVLRGQAAAVGGLPYHLWRDVARRLVLDISLSDLEAGILKVLVPDIGVLLERDIPDVPELPGIAGEQRLIFTLVDLFKRQTGPCVLLLEDLQWAAESLGAIRHMLAVREQFPNLLLIGTYRDDEMPELPDELIGMKVLKLLRLNVSAVARLTESMLGDAGHNPAVVGLLQQETEGNAFFMVETVRVLAEKAGALDAIGQITLPVVVFAGGVQQIIQRRLNRMPERFRPLLKRAAVTGRMLDTKVLGCVAAGEDLEAFLAAGANASLFEIVDGVWVFSHDKLREGVLSVVDAEARRNLHREVAQALEASYPDDIAYHEALLSHWRMADDAEKELHYLILVVNHLLHIRAEYARADALAARGLTMLRMGDPRTATLLNVRSRVNWQKGNYAEAEQWARQALAVAESLGESYERVVSLNSLGAIHLALGQPARAIDSHEQALATSRAIGHQRGTAESLNNLGNVAKAQGAYPTAQTYYEQSLAICREIGDRLRIAANLGSLGQAAMFQGAYAAAQAYYEQSLALGREIGDKRGIALNLSNLGNVMGYQGLYAASQDFAEQSLALFREMGDKHNIGASLTCLGNVAVYQGAFAAAQAYHEQALALFREIGLKRGIAASLLNLGETAKAQGAYMAAQEHLELALAVSREMGGRQSIAECLAYLNALQVELGAAAPITTLREGLSISLDIRALPEVAAHLAVLARCQGRAGRAAQAAELVGLVEAHPATMPDIRNDLLSKIHTELKGAIPAGELAAHMARGAVLDLEATARDLLMQPWDYLAS